MRSAMAFLSALMSIAVLAPFGQPSQVKSSDVTEKIVGIWRCEMEGLPAVTLTVTDEAGSLSGAVLFYLHRRDPGQPVTAAPGVPEPLFHLSFDGDTLKFQVSHRRAHPPGSLNDAPVSFRLKLTGADKAEFVNENEVDPSAPKYVLTRSAY